MAKTTEKRSECAACRLANGLRIVQHPSPSDVTYCGYVVDAGTRDELPDEAGMAHFVEHLLFKGTTHRKAWHILNRMERVGGDLNAYTSKEETTIYSTFLSRDFQRAAELLTDIVFHSTFPPGEIEKETEVIADEIQSYLDSPAEQIYDDFEALIFPGHPLGRNILGDARTLRTFSSRQALRFTQTYYRPENSLFFLYGNIPLARIRRTLERLTADLGSLPPPPLAPQKRIPPADCPPRHAEIRHDTHQAHVLLGTKGYHAFDRKRTALYLLNNLLGGPGMNSRLNLALRERRGLVYGVESSLVSYTDSGVFSIYFGSDPQDAPRCTEIILRELRRLRTRALTDAQLTALKKQTLGQIAVAADSNESMALELGKSFLHYDRFEPLECLFRRIESLTPQQLLEVANEIFDEARLSRLTFR